MTSRALYSDGGETVSELTSEFGSEETSSEYYASSLDISPYPSPAHVMMRSEPQPTTAQAYYDKVRSDRFVMNDRDKTIYNSLGSSSSPAGKVRVLNTFP